MTDKARHIPITGPEEGTPEWFAKRRLRMGELPCIGASDAAAACGRSQYRQPLDLYLMATGQLEHEFSPDQIARMRRGRRFQSVILAEYQEEFGCSVTEPGRMFIHPDYPFVAATPDGIRLGTRTLVEAKTASPYMHSVTAGDAKYGEEGTDIVPDEVLFQAQQQMSVMDFDMCDVVVLWGVFKLMVFPIPRNDDIIDAIISAEEELVNRIVALDPPEPNWSHPRTRELISRVNGLRADAVVQLDGESAAAWVEAQRLSANIKKLEESKKECVNKVLWAMGDAEIANMPLGEKQLRRVVVHESYWTDADILEAQSKQGQVKRKRYERLIERKSR